MTNCACFSWCDKAQLAAFLDGLPSAVSDAAAPWYKYAARVYRTTNLSLPLNVSRFGYFTFPFVHPSLVHRWRVPSPIFPSFAFDTRCAVDADGNVSLAARWCGEAMCAGYSSTPMPRLQLNLSRLEPWPWNWAGRLRVHHRLYSSEHKVFFARSHLRSSSTSKAIGQQPPSTMARPGSTPTVRHKAKFEFSRPGDIIRANTSLVHSSCSRCSHCSTSHTSARPHLALAHRRRSPRPSHPAG